MTFISRYAEKKAKNLEGDLSSCQEDLLSAERKKRAAQYERDDLSKENATLLREKNQAQEEKRRMESRMGELEEEKEEVIFICLYFLVKSKQFRSIWLLRKVRNAIENSTPKSTSCKRNYRLLKMNVTPRPSKYKDF